MRRFEKTYKQWLDDYRPEPPADVWEGIEDELDIGQAWEGVQDELDVMTSWRVIENHLDGQKRRRFIAVASIAASLLILAVLGFWQVYQGDGTGIATPNLAENNLYDQPVLPASPELTSKSYSSVEMSYLKTPRPVTIQAMSGRQIAEDLPENTYRGNGLAYLEASKQVRLYQEVRVEKRLAHVATSTDQPDEHVSKEPSPSTNELWKNNSYGVYASLSNTWIMNNKTISGLQADELVATQASYGKDLGLFYMQPLSEKIAVRAEYLFYSQANQNYHEYYKGRYVGSSISMKYQQLNMLVHWQPAEKNLKHTLYLGGYGGYLYQASQHIGDEKNSLLQEYRRFDYGILGGYWYQLPAFQQRVPLAVGIRLKYGLPNVFQGNESVPADFSTTRNLAFQLTFSVGLESIQF